MSRSATPSPFAAQTPSPTNTPPVKSSMSSNQGYDVVVDVDQEGELGHTDLHDDNLEFHASNFDSSAKPAATAAANGSTNHTHKRSSSNITGSGKKYLWSIAFYAQFFDVDTGEVLRRALLAGLPTTNFLDLLDGNPDLYGPFWLATTVVVILFLTGTMSWKLAKQGTAAHASYDFTLLSGAAGLIYGYTALVPAALWAALKWSGSEAANLLELLALYGYANVIWVPVSIISWSKLDIMNYVFVGLGFAVSVAFLLRNLWPVISTTPHQRAKVLLVLVAVLHFGLAVAIKFFFFAHNSPVPTGGGGKGKEPAKDETEKGDETDTDGEGDKAATMLLVRAAVDLLRL